MATLTEQDMNRCCHSCMWPYYPWLPCYLQIRRDAVSGYQCGGGSSTLSGGQGSPRAATAGGGREAGRPPLLGGRDGWKAATAGGVQRRLRRPSIHRGGAEMAVAIPTGGVQRWPSPSLLEPNNDGRRHPCWGGVTNGWEAVSALGVSADGQVNHSGGWIWGGRLGG